MEWLRDPSLYPVDPVRDTLPYYVSVLWKIIAVLPAQIPLEPTEFVLFLLVRALVFLSAVRLVLVLAPGNWLAVVGVLAMLGLVPQPVIALSTLMEGSFEQSGTAVPFVLLTVADFLDRRYWRAGLWLGVVANLTILYAVYLLPYLLLFALLHPAYRADWRRWMYAGGIAMVIASPVLVWILRNPAPAPRDVELWYLTNRFRSPFHLFPLAFALTDWLMLCTQWAFALALILWGGRSQPLWRLLGLSWLLGSTLWMALAFFAAYGVHSPFLLRLQPARAVDLWVLLAGVLTVCIGAYLLDDALQKHRLASQLTGAIVWSVSIHLWSLLPHPKALWFQVVAVVGVVLGSALLSVWRRAPISPASLQAGIALVVALTVSINAVLHARAQEDLFEFAQDLSCYRIAGWAAKNTPKDALWLVPPGVEGGWGSFRALAKRSVFVTWKDGTNILFAPGYTEHWVERIACLGFDIRQHRLGWHQRSPVDGDNINRLYLRLSDERVRDLAARYGIDYWVVPTEKPSHFPVVFSDGRWKVLQVRTPATSTTPTSQPSRESHR